jgi:GT2 family glycosyltransferase
MADVSIIIVNYNGRACLGELFESLAAQSHPADEVTMVDNASSDGSAEFVRKSFPWVTVIVSPTNTGFAEGNNIGAAHTKGEYIALLNSDTVVDEGWLAELVQMLDSDQSVGAAVSKVYFATDKPVIDCAGAEFNNIGFCWGRGSNEPDQGQFDTIAEVPSVTACAMIVRREALDGAPLFDRRLFMYYEEFDLALRLRGAGYLIKYVPTAIVYHKRSQAVKHASQQPRLFHLFYTNRNRVKILAKYYPCSELLRSLPLILLSLAYCDWIFLRQSGLVFFSRAIAAQVKYAWQGFIERLRGSGVKPDRWLPWMTKQGLREVIALRSKLGSYIQ